jgi:hypothetical protein
MYSGCRDEETSAVCVLLKYFLEIEGVANLGC